MKRDQARFSGWHNGTLRAGPYEKNLLASESFAPESATRKVLQAVPRPNEILLLRRNLCSEIRAYPSSVGAFVTLSDSLSHLFIVVIRLHARTDGRAFATADVRPCPLGAPASFSSPQAGSFDGACDGAGHSRRDDGLQKGVTYAVRRKRMEVDEIMRRLGPHVRKAYRMDADDFDKLHATLEPALVECFSTNRRGRKRRGAPNGHVSTRLRLSAAILFFAGGKTHDTMVFPWLGPLLHLRVHLGSCRCGHPATAIRGLGRTVVHHFFQIRLLAFSGTCSAT